MKYNNVVELREMLANQIEKTLEGEQSPAVLKHVSNAAGKMIATAKLELEYAHLRGETPEIPFITKSQGTSGA